MSTIHGVQFSESMKRFEIVADFMILLDAFFKTIFANNILIVITASF